MFTDELLVIGVKPKPLDGQTGELVSSVDPYSTINWFQEHHSFSVGRELWKCTYTYHSSSGSKPPPTWRMHANPNRWLGSGNTSWGRSEEPVWMNYRCCSEQKHQEKQNSEVASPTDFWSSQAGEPEQGEGGPREPQPKWTGTRKSHNQERWKQETFSLWELEPSSSWIMCGCFYWFFFFRTCGCMWISGQKLIYEPDEHHKMDEIWDWPYRTLMICSGSW